MQTIPCQSTAGRTDAGRAGHHPRRCDRQPQGRAGLRFLSASPASVLTAMTTPPVPTGAAQNISLPTIPSRACLRTARSLCRTAARGDPHGVQLPDAVQPQNDRRHGQCRQDDDEGVLLRGALRLRQDPPRPRATRTMTSACPTRCSAGPTTPSTPLSRWAWTTRARSSA